MIFEIASTLAMGGLAGWSFMKSNSNPTNDGEKIRRIFENAGLTVSDAGKRRTIRLYRKRKFDGGVEYVYQMPLGLSFNKIRENQSVIEDGLNVRSHDGPIDFAALARLKLTKPLAPQIKRIFKPAHKTRKETDLDFDGMLKIRVYDEPLPAQIDWDEKAHAGRGWSVPIGVSRAGLIRHDFEDVPHLIVAGATGFGKSVFLKRLIATVIEAKPRNVKLTLIDLKEGSAFSRFRDAAQIEGYAENPDEALDALKSAQAGMSSIMRKIRAQDCEDASEAGIRTRHFVIIDEAADLDKEALEIVKDIARRGRGPGYRLIYATQYPTTETIPSQVKRNIPNRLCFVLDSATASTAVLDGAGAEQLPEIKGRAIYKRVKQTVVQTPYMSNKRIAERMKPHITIRSRGDTNESEPREEGGTNGKHTIVIE